MAFLGMRYREDYWFVGGLVMALVAGVVAGTALNVILLGVAAALLVFVWLGTLMYCVIDRPGPVAVWLALAIPVLLIAMCLSVIVSLWGFFR